VQYDLAKRTDSVTRGFQDGTTKFSQREGKTMKRKWVGLVAGVAMVGWAAAAMAGHGWGKGMGPGGGGVANPYAASYLGLTPEQTSQLQAMRERHFKEIAPLQEKLFAKKQELRLLWANPNPDASQITAKQKEITALQAQIQELSTKHQLEARSILTPEQQQKLSVMRGPGLGAGLGWGKRGRGW
jgi:Spy/CpxP family protein refolding chaperone